MACRPRHADPANRKGGRVRRKGCDDRRPRGLAGGTARCRPRRCAPRGARHDDPGAGRDPEPDGRGGRDRGLRPRALPRSRSRRRAAGGRTRPQQRRRALGGPGQRPQPALQRALRHGHVRTRGGPALRPAPTGHDRRRGLDLRPRGLEHEGGVRLLLRRDPAASEGRTRAVGRSDRRGRRRGDGEGADQPALGTDRPGGRLGHDLCVVPRRPRRRGDHRRADRAPAADRQLELRLRSRPDPRRVAAHLVQGARGRRHGQGHPRPGRAAPVGDGLRGEPPASADGQQDRLRWDRRGQRVPAGGQPAAHRGRLPGPPLPADGDDHGRSAASWAASLRTCVASRPSWPRS